MVNPKLRFKRPDGTAYPDWEEHPLSHYLFENNERNRAKRYGREDVLSVSKDVGVVYQMEYMGKSLAGEDMSNYHVVYPGNIIYTKSPLGQQPYGIIRCSSREGIVSTLYAVYHCRENILPEMVDAYYSRIDALNNYLKPLVNIGAKHDMKVHNDVVLTGVVVFPTIEEQRQIVKFVQAVDEKINAQEQYVAALETQKKELLRQVFAREIRFKDENGQDYPEWENRVMEKMFDNIVDKNHPDATVLTIIQGEGTFPRDSVGRRIQYDDSGLPTYKMVHTNDFIMHLRSFEGGLEMATCDGIVSPAYTILRSPIPIVPALYKLYFRSFPFIDGKLKRITEGIRDGRSINMGDFWKLEIPYPSLPEQQRIADFFTALDAQIENERALLEDWRQLKKGLLQQMFA